MEQEVVRSGRGGGVVIAAMVLLGLGGVVVPKVADAISDAYAKARERALVSMISADLDGAEIEVDPRGKTMLAPKMEKADLLKALYVLRLRNQQAQGVIDGIRNAAMFDGFEEVQ
jgi:hypothetical protein